MRQSLVTLNLKVKVPFSQNDFAPCAYQGVRNVSFSEDFAYVLNGWPLKKKWGLHVPGHIR